MDIEYLIYKIKKCLRELSELEYQLEECNYISNNLKDRYYVKYYEILKLRNYIFQYKMDNSKFKIYEYFHQMYLKLKSEIKYIMGYKNFIDF